MTFRPYENLESNSAFYFQSIPAHWKTSKLRHVARFCGGGTPDRSQPGFWGGEIPWISPKDMKVEKIAAATERITALGLSESSSNLVPPGSVLIVVRSGILKHTIPVAINTVPAAINQDMKALTFPSGELLPAYVLRWIQGLNTALLRLWSKQGATVESIEHDYLANTHIAIPPLAEQARICSFLDRETSKLDCLIVRQEQLIEHLDKKQQAIVSNAVLRGLNSACSLQDSGNTWIGKIPSNWTVTRLKYVADVRSGATKGRDLSGQVTITVPYMRVANVQDGYLDLDDVASIEIATDELERFRLEPGDVLMNEGGDNDKLGRGHIWRGEISPCIHQNHVFAVRPFAVEPEWLNWANAADYARSFFLSRAKQSTNLASISSTSLRELPIPYPPEAERGEIVAYLDKETNRISALIAKARHVIDLMREHRSALVAAAVTGKVDVREAHV